MFREWNFANYRQIAQGLIADNAIVYRGMFDDSLRFIWYTKWSGAISNADFWAAYSSLIHQKRNIVLPPEFTVGSNSIINDTINKIYLERTDSTVIVMEDYVPRHFSNWLGRLHATKAYLSSSSMAKRNANSKKYPHVDKNILEKGITYHFRANE